jgi:hypothetical protein
MSEQIELPKFGVETDGADEADLVGHADQASIHHSDDMTGNQYETNFDHGFRHRTETNRFRPSTKSHYI